MREQNVLEQALASLAADETQALEQQMTFADMQAAKKMQQAHSKENLSLIRKHTRSFRPAPFLRAAAAIALVVGGLMLLRTSTPEKTENLTPAAPQALPYYTATTPSTLPEVLPTVATSIPTLETNFSVLETPSSTYAPKLTPSPVPTSTPSPSPTPTQTPTPTATTVPTATVSLPPMPAVQHPEGWQGSYFPGAHPDQWSIKQNSDALGSAVYADNYEFTEYAGIAPPPGTGVEPADYQYLTIQGVPALLTEDKAGQYTLTWNMEGHTLTLFSPDGEKETLLDIANSVIKLPEN